jgi:hypothetical protein
MIIFRFRTSQGATAMPRSHTPVPRIVGLTAILLLTGALAACSGSPATGQTDPGSGDASQGPGQGVGAGGQRQPGVTGKIAAVSGKTLQVQSSDAQTAVTYTAKTTFTEVTASAGKALAVGLCATVRSADDASPATAETVTAESVTLSKPTGGTCEGGVGGGFGGGTRPSGAPSDRPSGAPSGMPSGGPNGQNGRGMGANGKILSVDGSSFLVESTRPGTGGQPSTAKITVISGDRTTWTMVGSATDKAVAVGKCVTATGSRSSTGAVTASTLRLSKAVNGTCSTGFAGRNGGGQPSGNPSAQGNG